MTLTFDERNKWVNIEVTEDEDGTVNFFFAPEKLELPAGWIGNIIWHLFTPGWELSDTEGVVFSTGSGFNGTPQPDPTRPGCWSTPAANEGPATFHYTVNVHRLTDPSTKVSYTDPVVENDPPAPGQVQKRRLARRRETSRRQNAS
jgi:hypothetical protein